MRTEGHRQTDRLYISFISSRTPLRRKRSNKNEKKRRGTREKNRKKRKESGERKRIRGAKGIHQWLLLGVRISQPLTSAPFWDRSNADAAKLLFRTYVCPWKTFINANWIVGSIVTTRTSGMLCHPSLMFTYVICVSVVFIRQTIFI